MKKIVLSCCALLSVISPVFAIETTGDIDAATAKIMTKLIEWRRHLHQYPELGNQEVKTAKYVETHLRKLGLEVRTGIDHPAFYFFMV